MYDDVWVVNDFKARSKWGRKKWCLHITILYFHLGSIPFSGMVSDAILSHCSARVEYICFDAQKLNIRHILCHCVPLWFGQRFLHLYFAGHPVYCTAEPHYYGFSKYDFPIIANKMWDPVEMPIQLMYFFFDNMFLQCAFFLVFTLYINSPKKE